MRARASAKPSLLKRALACLLSAAMCVAFTPVVAWGAENVSYLDASGNEQTCDSATDVASSDATWGTSGSTTWYVARGAVTIGSPNNGFEKRHVTVTGDVRLILADDCELTVNGGIEVEDPNSLTIYAQSTGNSMGKLTATNVDYSNAGIGSSKDNDRICGSITINGGTIEAIGDDGAGIGGAGSGPRDSGTIIINGGTVTATAKSGAGIGGGNCGNGGTVTINGGAVTATAKSGAGIGGGSGGNGGTVTINGGAVTATANSNGVVTGAGIGGGCGGCGGIVIVSGGAVTAASTYGAGIGGGVVGGLFGSYTIGDGGILAVTSDTMPSYSGNAKLVIKPVENGSADLVLCETFTLSFDLTIPSGKTLEIGSDQTLTIAEGMTLTNEGNIENNGALANNGTLTNNGTVESYGSIDNEGVLTGGGEIKIALTLHTNGGEYSAGFEVPSFYTYSKEEKLVSLPVAEELSSSGEVVPGISRGGYTFEGWYETSDFSGARVYSVPSNCLTAKSYYAKWTLIADGITTDTGSLDFGTKEYGYSDFNPIPVTIKRNGATGDVTLVQPADSSFLVIGDLEYSSSDKDVIATFTIKPSTDLTPGSYSAPILVSGTAANSDGAQREVKTFVPVSFTVKKASPKLTITPQSSTVRRGEAIELTVSSDIALPENAILSLEYKQDIDLGAAEKVPLERISGNCFRAQVAAPPYYGTYRFLAKYVDNTGNYNDASAECEISVDLGTTIDPLNLIAMGNGQEIGAVVSGGQAELKAISRGQLESMLKPTDEGAEAPESLDLDLSNIGSTVTSTKISKETFGNIAGAVNSSDNSVQGMRVNMSIGSVALDSKALSSVASQASGGDVTVGLEQKKQTDLSALQQAAVKLAAALYGCYEATVTSGGSAIHTFGSGTVTLSFPFEPAPGTDPKNYRLANVSEAGKLEFCPTTIKGKTLSGTLRHLSTYAIVYIEPAAETLALAAELEALPAAGKLKAAGAKAAVKAAKRLLERAAALPDDQRAVVDELVAGAEAVVERGNELIAKADERAAAKVRDKAFSVKAGKSKAIYFKTKSSSAGTKVAYAKAKGSKLIAVTKSGKLTAKKGMRPGKTYTAKVKVNCGKAIEYVKVKVKAR